MEITLQEKEMLLSLLNAALGETRTEVHHTRTFQYHEKLKVEEEHIRQLIEKIQNQPATD